ncbi:dolichyl-diphosphooligosaccharide--protein glycosyltransferase subunit 4 [Aspergillus ibericus CBS 121593]|uniref:Dolichyl-diphosphooligosaccharide--protein glycosyltransferase subunit 4 n=1 Tax=Aspergillus ibericus CBS 121593 TaxID=1448316 RepID=A0A395GQA3_9EURO|nr:hypothetical protein BO80DRAFT_428183 [Aspergillus ibericus CBS 121593]RAK97512.1 hypothetical protein BO80DRAFT_428183 [Aspergillus ibericus CBS 121593]
MITDEELHRLAVFLGSCAMMMIVLYHFLEVNAKDHGEDLKDTNKQATGASAGSTPAAVTAGTSSATGGGKDR